MAHEQDPQFDIACGSVAGRRHVVSGKPNQDAYWWRERDGHLVAVVTDGCGSGAYSEVGARLGARLVGAQVLKRARAGEESIESRAFWEGVRSSVLSAIEPMAMAMGDKLRETVTDFFLFTVLGLLVSGDRAVVFGIGDGFVVIGEERLRIGPFSRNAPPYLAYGLLGEGPRFFIHRAFDRSEMSWVLLGTDGAVELESLSTQILPGSTDGEEVGPLSQLWEEERYFNDRDAIGRWLSQMSREPARIGAEERRMTRRAGLLEDDTTVLVVRRRTRSAIKHPSIDP